VTKGANYSVCYSIFIKALKAQKNVCQMSHKRPKGVKDNGDQVVQRWYKVDVLFLLFALCFPLSST